MDDSAENETPADTPELRRRIDTTLAQHLWLRFHVGVLAGSTIVAGFLTSLALQRYDPLRTALGPRYAISSLVAYLCFLLGVRWWVKYFAGIRPSVGGEDDDRGRFEIRSLQKDKGADGRRDNKPVPDGCGDGCLDPGCFDLEGALVVAVFLGAFFSLFWIFSSGPLILTEVAADTLFAGGLLRWARRTEAAWMLRSVRNTIIPFLVATASLYFVGSWVHYHCPAATRIGQAWGCAWN